jgi:hypothetical protein
MYQHPRPVYCASLIKTNTNINMERITRILALFVFLITLLIGSIVSANQTSSAASADKDSTTSGGEWFRKERVANFAATITFSLLVVLMVLRGRRGKTFYIRPIAGLDAVEDAVGRAAEMGRPIAFVPGLSDISDPATVAAMSLLSKVAHRAARLRSRVLVPNYSALTFPVARNVVRDAFMRAGRSASYTPDDVTFLTSRHMTYTMAVIGTMSREKIAASFLVGHFYSESLILAETGASLGAVQIGACDAVSQLPFFITTCDHTLIGEELFAGGALLNEDPSAASSIVVHDWFKLVAALLMLIALILWLLNAFGVEDAGYLATRLSSLLKEGK